MAAKNDITGDSLRSKSTSDDYRDNWERIYGKRSANKKVPVDESSTVATRPNDDQPSGTADSKKQ